MTNNKLFTLLAIALTMAITSGVANASTIEQLIFTGTGGIVAGNYYTAPYFGTLDGVNEMFVCVDDAHDINNGDTWSSYIGDPSDLFHARYTGPNQRQVYSEEFTLANEMLAQWGLYQTGTPSQQLAAANQIRFLQVLGWDITNPGSQLLSTDQQTYLASLENQNLTTGDFAGWHVASDINGSKQEFVFYEAPEPTSIILFGTGVVVLSFLRWRRRRTKK